MNTVLYSIFSRVYWTQSASLSLSISLQTYARMCRYVKEQSGSMPSSFICLVKGRIAAEAHVNGASPSYRQEIFSVQKSILAILIGMSIDKFRDGLDTPLPGLPAPVRLRHALTMTLGLGPDDSLTEPKPNVPPSFIPTVRFCFYFILLFSWSLFLSHKRDLKSLVSIYLSNVNVYVLVKRDYK